MARMEDLSPAMQKHLIDLDCPEFDETPFVKGPPLSRRRTAIISTAGIHLRSDKPFSEMALEYRVIPRSALPGDIVMSHVSANFDRSGFQQDLNVIFPLERLKELEQQGFIGEVAEFHYSFMGASDPVEMVPLAKECAKLLKGDRVDALLLVPV